MKSKIWKIGLRVLVKNNPFKLPKVLIRAIVIDVQRHKKEPAQFDAITGKAYDKAYKKYVSDRIKFGCVWMSVRVYLRQTQYFRAVLKDFSRNLVLAKPIK